MDKIDGMKWGLESHPTVQRIPLAIWAMKDGRPAEPVIFCEKDHRLYEHYKAIVDAHNAALVTPAPRS